MLKAVIARDKIDVNNVIEEIMQNTFMKGSGALAVFIGYVKGVVDNNRVQELIYHVYEPYASRKLKQIIEEEKDDDVQSIVVYHRVGRLKPGEPTIYIFVSATSRKKAFDKAEKILERIKHEVPIFKLEKRSDGEYWVLGNGKRIKRSTLKPESH